MKQINALLISPLIKISILLFLILPSSSSAASINRYDATSQPNLDKAAGSHKFSHQLLDINKQINQTKQNAFHFVKTNNHIFYEIKPEYEKTLVKKYLQAYFLPWNNPFQSQSLRDILSDEKQVQISFLNQPGWSVNRYPHSKAWIKSINLNMQLQAFPNFKHHAIVIHPTNLRVLPTIRPSYGDPQVAGQGYPFDNLQISRLRANLPILIVQRSKNRAWYLILTPNKTLGWVQVKDIALVNKRFINQWQRKQYITPIKENIPIIDRKGLYHFSTRIGEIYPLFTKHRTNYSIDVAVKNSNGIAIIRHVLIDKKIAAQWPLTASTLHIAKLANNFLGIPYGWGDLYGYRDCSTTTKDLYAAFAIYLPRHSTDQADTYDSISLKNMSPKQKEKLINEKGIPFFSLIWMPGHIVVYAGKKNGVAYIFHSPWGVHRVTRQGKPARIIIGRTVIDPINLGQGIFGAHTRLDQALKLVFLVPKNKLLEVKNKTHQPTSRSREN